MAVSAVHEGVVAGAALVGDAGQVGVAFLAVLADHGAVVVGVGGQEVLGVVVAVHDDLAQRVVHGRVGAALRHQVLQEGVQQLQPIALLHLHVNKFQHGSTHKVLQLLQIKTFYGGHENLLHERPATASLI